jgi:hypothetical protein
VPPLPARAQAALQAAQSRRAFRPGGLDRRQPAEPEGGDGDHDKLGGHVPTKRIMLNSLDAEPIELEGDQEIVVGMGGGIRVTIRRRS